MAQAKKKDSPEAIDPKLPKVIVVFDETGNPQYTFSGEWTGKILNIIIRCLPMAYRRYMQGIRKQSLTAAKEA